MLHVNDLGRGESYPSSHLYYETGRDERRPVSAHGAEVAHVEFNRRVTHARVEKRVHRATNDGIGERANQTTCTTPIGLYGDSPGTHRNTTRPSPTSSIVNSINWAIGDGRRGEGSITNRFEERSAVHRRGVRRERNRVCHPMVLSRIAPKLESSVIVTSFVIVRVSWVTATLQCWT